MTRKLKTTKFWGYDLRQILLIEDNADHAELIKRALEDDEHPVSIEHVPNGAAAMRQLMQWEQASKEAETEKTPLPHLILLDLRLPKVDGLEVLRHIKTSETLFGIPVVILTTSTSERDLNQAYKLNVNSYLQKPCDFAQFNTMLESMTRFWLQWNRHPTQP